MNALSFARKKGSRIEVLEDYRLLVKGATSLISGICRPEGEASSK
jgi:hypothetical protein